MTLRELISDYELLFQKLKLSKDSRFTRAWIDSRIRKYRGQGIYEAYRRWPEIKSEWLQDMGKQTVTPVCSSDDPELAGTSLQLGKITLPKVVSLPFDRGYHRLSGTSKMTRYYPEKFDRWMGIPDDHIQKKYPYHLQVGETVYITPFEPEINAILILENPMDGIIIRNEIVGKNDLTVGESYTVYDTQIIHNSVAYNPGVSFTAATTTYSGNGYVKFTIQKRSLTIDDQYPIGVNMLDFITRMIFTVELGIESQRVADVVNDSQDQLAVVQQKAIS